MKVINYTAHQIESRLNKDAKILALGIAFKGEPIPMTQRFSRP